MGKGRAGRSAAEALAASLADRRGVPLDVDDASTAASTFSGNGKQGNAARQAKKRRDERSELEAAGNDAREAGRIIWIRAGDGARYWLARGGDALDGLQYIPGCFRLAIFLCLPSVPIHPSSPCLLQTTTLSKTSSSPFPERAPTMRLPDSELPRSWCVFLVRYPGNSRLTLSQDFRSASTGVAAKQMRNEINKLIESVADPEEKRAFANEMQNFFMLFNRFLQEKARGEKL